MKISNNLIGSLLLSGSIVSYPLVLDKLINEEIINVKTLTEKILSGGKSFDKDKLASIYNPLNPGGIKTDDGYIYIV